MIIISGRVCSQVYPFSVPSNLVLSVRANRARIPTSFNHASPPSFDTIADMIDNTLLEAPQSHERLVGRVLSFTNSRSFRLIRLSSAMDIVASCRGNTIIAGQRKSKS